MITIEETARGLVITLRAYPRGGRNAVKGEVAGALQVSTTQAPERGKANEALLATVASALDLRKGDLELLSGASARRKRVLITGLTRADLESRVRQALSG